MEQERERRSSILKFRTVPENVQDNFSSRRRVSFSQTKFIKEFDASLNTLQNSTYEEISKESENDTPKHMEVNQVEMNSKQVQSLFTQIETVKENINPLSFVSQCYEVATSTEKQSNHTILDCNTMDFTEIIQDHNTSNTKSTIFPFNEENKTYSVMKNRRSILSPQTMDFTSVVSVNDNFECAENRQHFPINIRNIRDTMDLTNIVRGTGFGTSVHLDESSVDMDLTATNDNHISEQQNCIKMVTPFIQPNTENSKNVLKERPNDKNSNHVLQNIDASEKLINLENKQIEKKQFPTLQVYDVDGGVLEKIHNNFRTSSLTEVEKTKNYSVNFHSSFSGDDTDYLINYRVSDHNVNKAPKSDFSKLISGDLSNNFLPPKFLPLTSAVDFFPDVSSSCDRLSKKSFNKSKVEHNCTKTDSNLNKNNSIASTEGNFTSFTNVTNKEKSMNIDKSFVILSESVNKTNARNISDESIVSFDSVEEEKDVEKYKKEAADDIELKSFLNRIKAEVSLEIDKTDKIRLKELSRLDEMKRIFKKEQASSDELHQKTINLLTKSLNIFNNIKWKCEPNNSIQENVSIENNSSSLQTNQFFELTQNLNVPEKILSIEEKILQLQKGCKNLWKLKSSENNEYKFETLDGNVEFLVKIDHLSRLVTDFNVNIKNHNCPPKTLFLLKEFLKKMDKKVMSSAIGKNIDYVTFLDYVHMESIQIKEMSDYFLLLSRIGFEMDNNFQATFKIPSIILRSVWVVSVDMSDMENLTKDCVSITAELGSADEEKIKKMLDDGAKGFSFLKNSISSILNFQRLLENRIKK